MLQEESQQVALGGDSDTQSLEALKGLTKLAAARGAKVGVDLTWAWLDGKNPKFPIFRDMQVSLLLYQPHVSGTSIARRCAFLI